MVRKKVNFYARKPIEIPKKVRFKTKEGKTISFTTKKTIKKPVKVSFYNYKKKVKKW